MNLKNVLRVYTMMRQFADDESALLQTLRGLNDSERELLVQSLQPQTVKKASKRASKKSPRASGMAAQLNKSLQQQRRVASSNSDNDDSSTQQCSTCDFASDHNIHHLATTDGYHEFVPVAEVGAAARGGVR